MLHINDVQLTAPISYFSFHACTRHLIQYSLPVITINSSLTQCTVGADQVFTNVYAISCQFSTVHAMT
jgi:hypothetical protein